MKIKANTIRGTLLNLRLGAHANGLPKNYTGDELPLRSELFSADQMQQHGKALASSHKLSSEGAPDQLLSRLAENEGVLIATRDLLAAAVQSDRRITPAGEWLLDHARVRAAGLPHDRSARQGNADRRSRIAGGRGPSLLSSGAADGADRSGSTSEDQSTRCQETL